ncbi:hypothetical protein RQP46_002100 [Phenoliferia psychrophenolica]
MQPGSTATAEITALRTLRATLQSLNKMTGSLADDLENAAGNYKALADVAGRLEPLLPAPQADARDGDGDARMAGEA